MDFHLVAQEYQGRGLFEVFLDGERIPIDRAHTPFLDAARWLLANGANPEAKLSGRMASSSHPGWCSTVGTSAKLRVAEAASGPVFRKWAPFSMTAGADLNGNSPAD